MNNSTSSNEAAIERSNREISEESARLKPRKAPPWTFEFIGGEKDRGVPRTIVKKLPVKPFLRGAK